MPSLSEVASIRLQPLGKLTGSKILERVPINFKGHSQERAETLRYMSS